MNEQLILEMARVCFYNIRRAFGWKLRCSYGVFDCISALVSLDLPPGSTAPFSLKTLHRRVSRTLEPTKPAENRLEMQPKAPRLKSLI